MTTEKNYTFGNLTITKTRIEDKSGVIKMISVERFDGEFCETLHPSDPDYKKALILSINEDNAQ
jgi:hypothetical protein